MIIRDVNNYIGEYTDGSTKLKGAFEIFQELHKNPSMRIVPIALEKYFINNIPINDTICNYNNIFDFCCELKTNKDWDGNYKQLTQEGIISTKLGKITRYYVSGGSGILQKKNVTDGREIGVCVGNGVVIFNKYEKKEMKDYKINYDYYIKECLKIINQIEDRQLKLF